MITTIASDPFAERFGKSVPADMRADTLGMSWASFLQNYCPTTGPFRFDAWSAITGPGGRRTFEATFGISDTVYTSVATAFGPVEALTDMLHNAGFHIEILAFHQQTVGTSSDAETATFVHCEHRGVRTWSMALAGDCMESSIRAIMYSANALHARLTEPHGISTV